MPAAYAHDRFGADVRRQLSAPASDLISREQDLFFLGVQGPDPLFNHLLPPGNPVRKKGTLCHDESGRVFFRHAFSVLEKEDVRGNDTLQLGRWAAPRMKEAQIAYLLGMVCHFVLDVYCHPCVAACMTEFHTAHAQIESQFDRLLLLVDGKVPTETKLTGRFRPSVRSDAAVAAFYEPLTFGEVSKAMREFVHVQDFLAVSPARVRACCHGILKLMRADQKIGGHFMPDDDDPACRESGLRLTKCYAEALPEAVSLADLLCACAKSGDFDAFLHEAILDRNFSGIVPASR